MAVVCVVFMRRYTTFWWVVHGLSHSPELAEVGPVYHGNIPWLGALASRGLQDPIVTYGAAESFPNINVYWNKNEDFTWESEDLRDQKTWRCGEDSVSYHQKCFCSCYWKHINQVCVRQDKFIRVVKCTLLRSQRFESEYVWHIIISLLLPLNFLLPVSWWHHSWLRHCMSQYWKTVVYLPPWHQPFL